MLFPFFRKQAGEGETGNETGLRLSNLAQERGEPGRRNIEMLAALDARKFDRGEGVAAFLVVTDTPALALETRRNGMIDRGADECQVLAVGGGRADEIARLLHKRALGADELGEALGKPVADIDLVDLAVTGGVAVYWVAPRSHFATE